MRRPPFDPTCGELVARWPNRPVDLTSILDGRRVSLETVESLRTRFDFNYATCSYRTTRGEARTIGVFTRAGQRHAKPGPTVVFIHGGGRVSGTICDMGLGIAADRYCPLSHLERYGGAVFSIEYGLAPEAHGESAVRDCYDALGWIATHADSYGADHTQVILVGESAGGGLALGTALMVRDFGGPRIAGLQLDSPMIDDRCDTVSYKQFDVGGPWSQEEARSCWHAVLDNGDGGSDVSPYVAPARAGRMDGLPPTLITVSSAEALRDECVELARAIWRDGGECELHVTPGGFHMFYHLAPEIGIAEAYWRTVEAWIARIVSPKRGSILETAIRNACARFPQLGG